LDTKQELAVQKWERRSTIPLAALALVYLALYAVEVLGDARIVRLLDLVLISDLIWAIFIVDFVARFVMHDDKKLFLKRNVIELIGLILPFFRAFRMFRVVIAIGFLARAAQTLQSRINIYLGIILPLLVFTCSLGVYDAEHDAPGATITNFGDAIWWALVTVTTVGYGDYYPVTFEGRFIAVLLMLSGLALVSVITVSFASWFLDRLNIEVTTRQRKKK
jgi:voltage-gated potassium channel